MNRIDELNIAGRSMPYEKYFGEMELSDRQKKERMEISEEFEDMMAFLFALLAVMDEYSYDDGKTKTAAKQVESRYLEILGAHMEPDDSLREYAREFARDIVETTIGHIDDPWYLSDDRAVFVAENEANTTYNYTDYRQAVGSGKTHKQWVTMKDQRVRKTHREVDGETIPIDEVFLVGESLMRFPKDTSLGASAEEIVNCRCGIRYIGKSEIEVEDSDKYDTIELQRKTENQRENFKFLTDEAFNNLTIEARKKGAIIIRGAEWAEEHLDKMGAAASIIGDVLVFRKDVCISEVLEETHHFEQNLSGMNDDKELMLRSILNEIDAKQYLLKISKKYKIPRNEIELTEKQLKEYQQQLKEYQR